MEDLQNSTTVYVGELPFNVSEHQVYSLFSRCGLVDKIIMGTNENTKQFEGFCFVM